MGNKFGDYAGYALAAEALLAKGFVLNARGLFAKAGMSGGNLFEAPRRATALVEITRYRVAGQYAPDGRDYLVYQHHYL